jgi:hypothetical protein
VADGLVGLQLGHGAVRPRAVAEALAAAAVVVAALVRLPELAVVGAAGTLGGERCSSFITSPTLKKCFKTDKKCVLSRNVRIGISKLISGVYVQN